MLKKTLALFGIFVILSLSHPPSSNAQTVLFSDNFDDGNSNGWNIIGASGWNVQNNRYGIHLDPGLSNSLPDDSLWNYGWTNIAYDVDVLGTSGVDKNILIKFQDTSNFIEIHANDHGIFLDKASTSGGGGTLWHVSTILQNGITYHFRTEISNNSHIKVFLDNILIFDIDESTPVLSNWKIGLRAGTGSTSPTEVWFDNVVVTELPPPTPTPTPSPTSTPSPTPTSTPIPISSPIGNFELPFSYTGRLTNNALLFKNAFWQRITAGFDHAFAVGLFRPFTGNTYFPSDCPGGVFGIKCYDSHNGTDFSQNTSTSVLSVGNGQIVFTSDHTDSACTPNAGGFGCVIIAKYPGNNYALFAHLSRIFVTENSSVSNWAQLGVMGETGCPGCGVHLHFGVLKPNPPVSAVTHMSRNDWKFLLYKIQPSNAPSYPPFCNYIAPNGANFTFVDPSGWMGEDKDPWSLPKNKGGCGVNSQYLWKFPVGVAP